MKKVSIDKYLGDGTKAKNIISSSGMGTSENSMLVYKPW